MINPAQIVLFAVIVILTALLIILGFQVYFILRALRETVNKANKVLDDTGVITESVSTPLSTLSSLVSGIKTGGLILDLLRRKKKRTEGKDEK